MTRTRSSQWKTILPAIMLGLIVMPLVMFGSSLFGSRLFGTFIPPTLILAVLFIGACVAAWRFPQHRIRLSSMIAGGVFGLMIFAVAAVSLFSGGLFSSGSQEDLKPAELEQWIGLDFPSSATKMRSHAEGFQDWQVFVRFEMPKGDVKEFLRINHLEPESNPNTQLSNTDLERDWWTPDQTIEPRLFAPTGKPGFDTQPATKTGFYPTIQVSDLDGERVLVHLSAFNT